MELTSVASQALPRTVNPTAGGQSRRDQGGQEGQRPLTEQKAAQSNAASESPQRTERAMDHHKDAVDSGRTREERQEADPFAPQNADAEKTRSEATEKAAGPHRPHARHAGPG